MERFRRISVCAVFFLLLALIPALLFLLPDREISAGERRKLQQAPQISADAVFSGRWQKDLETYVLDQFPARDMFRAAKAVCGGALLGRLDNNGLYEYDGYLCKRNGPLNEEQVLLGADKLNELRERYLSGSKCWYAVVPDKNYFTAPFTGYPSMDYNKLVSLLNGRVQVMNYVDLFSTLTLEDYYRTDTHWRQERLGGVLAALGEEMEFTPPDFSAFQKQTLTGFLGVYAGQSALPADSEDLYYLAGASTEQASVFDVEAGKELPVYQPEKFTGMDPYDVFLGGAKALLEIDTGAGTGRELLLFRDSFGSSLAPLLLDQYDKITLIDLRYLSSEKLTDYVDFHGQDVLFLYSTDVWNNSAMLR